MTALSLTGAVLFAGKLKEAKAKIGTFDDVRTALQVKPSVIRAADGTKLFSVVAENREWTPLSEIPDVVKNATIAAEDHHFYEHHGVNFLAVGRQILTNAKEGRTAGGASTLTMQLAKRIYTSPEKTYGRKIDDVALALEMEKSYTKEEILELYLNQVYYGSWAYGVSKACETYFGKPLKKITIGEAAMLARLVRRPSTENPFKDLETATANRDVVLGSMRELHQITEEQYEKALKETPHLSKKPTSPGAIRMASKVDADYFLDYVLDWLKQEQPDIDIARGGYQIDTTIDLKMQGIATEQVRKFVDRNRGVGIRTGAFLLINNEGKILAMVGGYDHERNQFNMVTQGRRQPGSSFKPFIYALARQDGVLAASDEISNEPTTFHLVGERPWHPSNSGRANGGSVSIRTALMWSMNVPAAHVMCDYWKQRGRERITHELNGTFGFDFPVGYESGSRSRPIVPPTVLGATEVSPLQMAEAYTVFQNGGRRVIPFGVTKIIGPDDQEILNHPTGDVKGGCLKPDLAQEMDGYLRAVVVAGTAREASSIKNARGKTGTTSDNKDAWFVGYTDKLLGVGWVANERLDKASKRWVYASMSSSVMGGTYTSIMWRNILERCQPLVHEDEANRNYAANADGGDDGVGSSAPVKPEDTPSEEVQGGDNSLPEQPKQPDINSDEPPTQPDDAGPDKTKTPKKEEDPGSGEDGSGTPPKSTPKATRGPDDKPRPKKSSDGEEKGTVTVMVCADTGELARDSCPEQTPRTYRKGREPHRYCHKHR